MILVTKPFSPPFNEYSKILEGVWERNYFTNNGPLVVELESKLCDYLNVSHVSFLTNGTISLQIALKILGEKGKILTTPFSYIATSSSIVWEGFEPVFIDIDENSLNVDVYKIEAAINDDVKGMLFTHCFGNPCEIEKIGNLSEKYNIPVLYDAAHCFGVEYNNLSVLAYGMMSSISFHATKIFHTIEGGALICNDSEIYKEIGLLRNFGHNGPETFSAVGINGKNSEFHAAMGLLNLNYIDEIILKRSHQYKLYQTLLKSKSITFQKIANNVKYNFAYMPIVLDSENQVLHLLKELNAASIFPRRYFYPSLNDLEIFQEFKGECPVSSSIASRILCLPLYHDLLDEEIEQVCSVILKTLNKTID
jgi:dTDP-4-amino-4,6-dideoxygalactose transaminase